MNGEVILIVVLIVLFFGGLTYLEIHSRRNQHKEKEQNRPRDED
jgi:Sec-independent protein secretion pathway component TatC